MKIASTATALTLIASTLFAATTAAADADLIINIASYHTSRDLIPNVNEKNLGLGLRFDDTVEIGFYENSYSELSIYAIATTPDFHGFSIFAGAASGYEKELISTDGGIAPLLGIQYDNGPISLKMTAAVEGVVFGFSINAGAVYSDSASTSNWVADGSGF